MESVDVLWRGVMMQGGHGMGVSFQGLEWALVAIVATIVIACVSAKRSSIVSVGWTWGLRPGQVRVRVHSFSSMSDGSIVTASGMFSAGILNCSADSCSEDAVSSSDVVSDTAGGKVAAEMVFFFEKKTPSANLLKHHLNTTTRASPDQMPRRRSKSLDYQRQDISALLLSHLSVEGVVKVPNRAGIEWEGEAFPCSFGGVVDTLLPSWAQSLTQPLVLTAPALPPVIVTNTYEFDPLFKLRIRDSVLCGSSPVNEFSLPLAPVTGGEDAALMVALKNDVVRLWDCEEKCVVKSVHLPKGYGGPVSAFDADWEKEVAALGRKGGLVSVANLESGVYEESYQTQQPVLQAVSLDKSSLAKTMFTGGPAVANPGCSVSLWDSRSSSRQLSVNLTSASNIYGIRSQGNELYVRDAAGSLVGHDVRMLGASSLIRVPCDVKKCESAPSEDIRWWDMDSTFDGGEEKDVEDEFWDCQAADDVKGVNSNNSYVGSLVMAMSRNFSSSSSRTSPAPSIQVK